MQQKPKRNAQLKKIASLILNCGKFPFMDKITQNTKWSQA
jgi:hypothetical protein